MGGESASEKGEPSAAPAIVHPSDKRQCGHGIIEVDFEAPLVDRSEVIVLHAKDLLRYMPAAF